jgi:NAD(P)H dehydrogenase (quinone)
MKIGILVHSQSGNTARLALAVTHALRKKGQEVDVELLRPIGKVHPGVRHVEFKSVPEVDGYDMVMLGGPVWAFNASPVVVSLLHQIPSLKGKKTMFFLTSGFPPPLSGWNRAHKKIKDLLEESNATVIEGESLFWGFYCGKKRLDAAVERICRKVLG